MPTIETNRWKWKAVYNDSTFLEGYSGGAVPFFPNVDQTKLIRMEATNDQIINYVNLIDGHFNLNGMDIAPTEQELPQGFNSLQVICCARVSCTTDNPPIINVIYRLGWQTNINGTNYKKVLEILSDNSTRFAYD